MTKKTPIQSDSSDDPLCNICGHVAEDISLDFWKYPRLFAASVSLPVLSSEHVVFFDFFFLYMLYQMSSENGRIADVTCRRWTAFAF